jgi:hypothetical protein
MLAYAGKRTNSSFSFSMLAPTKGGHRRLASTKETTLSCLANNAKGGGGLWPPGAAFGLLKVTHRKVKRKKTKPKKIFIFIFLIFLKTFKVFSSKLF